MTIGLIGAGSLGTAIGQRLLGCQLPLVVWNRSSRRLMPLTTSGAMVAATVAELVRDAPTIIVCLSDVDAIRAVLLDGAIEWLPYSRRLVLNTSTVGAEASAELEAGFAAAGVDYLDMPVSGGPEGAAAGNLAAYLGRSPTHGEMVDRILAALASNVVRCKSNQDAQRLKVLNNLCEAINLWGAAEAIALGRRLGLSLDDLGAGLTTGRGDSRYLRVLLEHLRTRSEDVAVSLAIRTKDLQLAEQLAVACRSWFPLSRLTKSLFDDASNKLGMGADQCGCLAYLAGESEDRVNSVDAALVVAAESP